MEKGSGAFNLSVFLSSLNTYGGLLGLTLNKKPKQPQSKWGHGKVKEGEEVEAVMKRERERGSGWGRKARKHGGLFQCCLFVCLFDCVVSSE